MKCRHCKSVLKLPLVDLGSAPPSNAYLNEYTLCMPEKWVPLRVLICEQCWLAQTEDFIEAHELFNDEYAYFSGFSSSWLSHCERYVANVVERFHLNIHSHVVEVAANDGYLLQYVKARDIPCIGIEPTASTAAVARAKGITIVEEFFGSELAKKLVLEGKQADLTIANNVLAHVPDINDFVMGFALLLKPQGVATFEFPHLLKLIAENQFDTIYHEHFSYLSLTTVLRIFSANGLAVFDVEEHPTHGGSLRVFAERSDTGKQTCNNNVHTVLQFEARVGMMSSSYYSDFQTNVNQIKNELFTFLIQARKLNKTVVGYGAAAKSNTLINYVGIRSDMIACIVDRNPAKQGKYMPGSRIPIYNENQLRETKPDYVIILPWNLTAEITEQLEYIRTWGGKFVTAVPKLSIEKFA